MLASIFFHFNFTCFLLQFFRVILFMLKRKINDKFSVRFELTSLFATREDLQKSSKPSRNKFKNQRQTIKKIPKIKNRIMYDIKKNNDLLRMKIRPYHLI